MSIYLTLINEKEVMASIDRVASALQREMVQGVNDGIGRIFARSQRDVPVRTGRLKASGSVSKARVASSRIGRGASVGAEIVYDAPYAANVEYSRNSFLRPAINAERGGEDQINAAIRRAVGAA